MSDNADKPLIDISTPGAGIAAIPYVLSFIPQHSCVLLWRDDRGTLVVTQRIDLPESTDARTMVQWAEAAFGHEGAVMAASGLAIFTVDDVHGHREVMDACLEMFPQDKFAGAYVTDFTVYRAYRDTTCVPITAHDQEEAVTALGRSMATRPAADRSEIEKQFAVDPNTVLSPALIAAVRTNRDQQEDPDMWALEVFESVGMSWLETGQRRSDLQLAELVVAVESIYARDTFLVRSAQLQDQGALQVSSDDLVAAVARVPMAERAPLATIAGILLYTRGDGLRARMSAERALEADPGYALGQILLRAVTSGLNPHTLRAFLADETLLEPESA